MRPFIIAAVITVASALPCVADTLDMSSVTTGQTNNVVHPINEGRMIVFTNTEYTANDQDGAGTLLTGMTGKCSGTIDLEPPAASGQGHCLFTTTAGDIAFTKWVATGMTAEGAIAGDWSSVGGTGAFANATGGGTFVSATDPATGKTQNTISGSVELQ
ncbi:MAG: hypothetical protein ACSHWS_11740 [Sulfitobacter sp.]